LFIIFIVQSYNVYASETSMAKIGNNYYDTLEDEIKNASSTDTISLINDVTLEETLEINKTVNINLNNNDIKAEENVFLVEGGSLNLSGKGTILETKPNLGAITLKGSTDPTKEDYSTVSVGSDVTLEGWSGIFITHNDKKSYGVLVNMNGTINAVNDINGGPGAGIYVNGNIKHEDNSPIINLGKTTKITSTGNGIYAAGYATYNINGAYIAGDESGLGIKSGVFNILDGTIVGTGEDKTPTSGNNNGINASGTAIQIESNNSYKGDIELYIKSGKIESKNSNVIYEYTINNINTKVKNISISGASYIANSQKDVFSLSDSFKNKHTGFISGGKFSSDPTNYLKNGYKAVKNDSLYEVVLNTIDTFSEQKNNDNNPVISIILTIFLIILAIIIFLKRNMILSILKR